MEIDFLGLYSKNPAPESLPIDAFVDPGMGSGEDGNVSLSLCTSSPMFEKTVLQDFLPKTPAENPTSIRSSACNYDWENVQPTERSCPSFVGKLTIGHSGFRYNLNDRSTVSRNALEPQLSFPVSSNLFFPNAASNFFPAQKADGKIYSAGDASFDDTRKSKDGYTPTVAMARKATLARFLEKRSHRMKQEIMGRSLKWFEACEPTFPKCNKKIKAACSVRSWCENRVQRSPGDGGS